jgi:hypothetical protein
MSQTPQEVLDDLNRIVEDIKKETRKIRFETNVLNDSRAIQLYLLTPRNTRPI